MSIWKYLFDDDWYQRDDIERLKLESSAATSERSESQQRSKELEDRITELEEDVSELTLFSQALLRMLLEKKVCAPVEFVNLVKMIGLDYELVDGRPMQIEETPGPRRCPDCERPLPKNRDWCLYCGAAPLARDEDR